MPLRHTWSDGTYYDYGWLIPPMLAWFLLRRLRLHPHRPLLKNSKNLLVPLILSGLFFILTALAIRVIQRVDVTWRPMLWTHAIVVYSTAHYLLALRIGWRASLSFWPVTVLGFMAVPITSGIENQLVGTMTAKVTDAAVFSLQWIGFPVHAAGGTISGPSGTVEVGKACSGIRSFQAILVTAWFFGEFLWCRIGARILLLAVGVVAAFTTNVVRAVSLAWVKFEHGTEAFGQWHDPIGYLAFAAAGLTLFMVARLVDQPAPTTQPQIAKPPQLQLIKMTSGLVLFSIVLVELMVWAHFRKDQQATAAINYRFPNPKQNSDRFSRINMGDLPEGEMLRFDGGGSGVFRKFENNTPTRKSMRVVYLEYQRSNPRFWMDLFAHAPEVCMGSVGAKLEKRFAKRIVKEDNFAIEFDSLKFRNQNNEPVFIFKGYWIEETLPDRLDDLRSLRLDMAKSGKTSPEGRLFWAGVNGIDDETEAWEFYKDKVVNHITFE